MGRPLFSAAYSTPAVRTEPEPAASASPYEKWSRWGSFDPDSDEFFDSDDAVYEAFLDAVDLGQGDLDARAAPEPIGVLVEREMERAYSPVESLSSDSTVSGRESPMAEGADDPAAMVDDAYYAPRRLPQTAYSARTYNYTRISDYLEATQPTPPLNATSSPPAELINERRVSRNVIHASPRTFIPPRPSTQNDTSAPVIMASASLIEATMVESAPVENPTPSPAPTVTPRMYSWNAYQSARAIPDSPTPAPRYRDSPLTNPNARISISHLSPAPTRISIRTA